MRMLKLGAALMLVAALAGCATLAQTVNNAETLYGQVKIAYTGTPKTVYVLESGYTVIQTAAAMFKTTQCPSVTSLGGACATIVPKLRAYNKAALAVIAPVEAYVRANPSLNAISLIQTAEAEILTISQEMTALGVQPAS